MRALTSYAHNKSTVTVLSRVLGPTSLACVGLGAAIGSGIFAAPGEAARRLQSPWLIISAWIAAGAITLLQALVTAELATRFPKAGGEYQYLREAYGEFAAFFFGWSFTVFIVGGGAGTIAALFGEFTAELFRVQGPSAPTAFGCSAIAFVVGINALGLRSGAWTTNILTALKTLILLGIAVGAIVVAGRATPLPNPPAIQPNREGPVEAFCLALLPVFWSYTGATDAAKLAEETRDVRRGLPRALCGATLVLTAIYCLYNYALLCAASPVEMAGRRSIPAIVFEKAGIPAVGDLLLLASAFICLGAISSTILANIRVSFALARDGLAPRVLSRMSRKQAPVGSLLLGGVLASAFVLNRSFDQLMRIYFTASTVLFGLTYLSLIVFRVRDRRAGRDFPASAFRMPLGFIAAIFLVGVELALAANIVHTDWAQGSRDSLWTFGFLGAMAALYLLWKRMGWGVDTAQPESS